MPAAPKQREAVGRPSFQRRRRPRPNSGTGRAAAPSRPPTSCGYCARSTTAEPGGIGAILRREGLYSSLLTDWRRQRDAGAYEALKAVRRGPKPAVLHPLAAEHAQLQRENKSLTLRLQRAEAVIEIQKKVALLLGLSMPSDEAS